MKVRNIRAFLRNGQGVKSVLVNADADSDGRAILLIYADGSTTDISNLVSTMNYVIWVGAEHG